MRVEKFPKIVMTKKEYDVLSEFAKVLSNYCEHDVVFCKDCSIYEWCHESSPEPKADWHASSGDAQILNKPTLAYADKIEKG